MYICMPKNLIFIYFIVFSIFRYSRFRLIVFIYLCHDFLMHFCLSSSFFLSVLALVSFVLHEEYFDIV